MVDRSWIGIGSKSTVLRHEGTRWNLHFLSTMNNSRRDRVVPVAHVFELSPRAYLKSGARNSRFPSRHLHSPYIILKCDFGCKIEKSHVRCKLNCTISADLIFECHKKEEVKPDRPTRSLVFMEILPSFENFIVSYKNK